LHLIGARILFFLLLLFLQRNGSGASFSGSNERKAAKIGGKATLCGVALQKI
jgi:hypothetical protein